jgi:hypothetical protein
VYSILPSGSKIYLGGFFTSMGGQTRINLAQVDTAQAASVNAFNAPTWSFQTVFILGADPPGVFELAETGGKLYASGLFKSILDKPHSAVAGLFTTTVGVEAPTEAGVSLRAQPNPGSGTQVMRFTVDRRGPVQVEVYNVAGRLVQRLGGNFEAGTHVLAWDGRDLAGAPVGPGLYFARMGTATTKLLRIAR